MSLGPACPILYGVRWITAVANWICVSGLAYVTFPMEWFSGQEFKAARARTLVDARCTVSPPQYACTALPLCPSSQRPLRLYINVKTLHKFRNLEVYVSILVVTNARLRSEDSVNWSKCEFLMSPPPTNNEGPPPKLPAPSDVRTLVADSQTYRATRLPSDISHHVSCERFTNCKVLSFRANTR